MPYDLLRKLRDLDRASPRFHEQLIDILRGDEYQNVLSKLPDTDVPWFIEYLDGVLIGIFDRTSILFRRSLQELGNICGVKEALPKSYTLQESLLGCVYEGTFDGAKVRIRRVKMYPGGDPQKVKEAFHQVAAMSKHLKHPNIVPLLGATTEPLELISEWMPGGDLLGYITKHPDSDRLSLLSDTAEGLNYLHSCSMVHGDLRGSTILVDAAGHARITDFGLAIVTQDPGSMRSGLASHNTRWIAPEIIDGQGIYCKEADVFSFAGVVIEAFTGAAPFVDKPPRAAMSAIAGGERPSRPTHPNLADGLWALTQECWNQEARRRPSVLEIMRGLNSIPALRRLLDHPLGSEERTSVITDIFSVCDNAEIVARLSGDDAQTFVDVIDEASGVLAPWLRRKCLALLCKICSCYSLLPRSVQIPLCYDRMGTPLCRGGFADVWEGTHEGDKVAVKVLTVYMTSDLGKITERFCKEVIAWRALQHQNVLPLLGVTMTNNQFAMVSKWMVNGNINDFVKTHRQVDRLGLLQGVATGLVYMHSEGMIHGDLKGANILIDEHSHACLADFGLTMIVSDPAYPTTSGSLAAGGTTRWMSPERLDPVRFGVKHSWPTRESDCHALGMVILEVLSGEVPFTRDCTELMVMQKVLEGGRPGRPQGAEGVQFTDKLWGTLQRCWLPQPTDRPAVQGVLGCLNVSMADFAALRVEQSSINSPPLTQTEAMEFVEIFEKVVSSTTTNVSSRNRCFKVLRKVSQAHGILPTSYNLGGVTLTDTIPYAGRFADTWKGEKDGRQVSVKGFRTQAANNLEKIKRRFYREIIAWKYVAHPNVVPFLGVSEAVFPLCLVSPWLQNGNILDYVRENQGANRLKLLVQAARGLEHLHSLSIVHGGVNPGNILIDKNGVARLGDFGITGVITDPTVVELGDGTMSMPGARYMAPELLNPTQFHLQNSNPTKESDVYSLAMTAYEVLTGILPYGPTRYGIIIFHVVTGDRPPRPQNARWLRDSTWNMIITCWNEQRELRLDIRTVHLQLSASSIQEDAEGGRENSLIQPSSNADEDPPSCPPPKSQGRNSFFLEGKNPRKFLTLPLHSNTVDLRGLGRIFNVKASERGS